MLGVVHKHGVLDDLRYYTNGAPASKRCQMQPGSIRGSTEPPRVDLSRLFWTSHLAGVQVTTGSIGFRKGTYSFESQYRELLLRATVPPFLHMKEPTSSPTEISSSLPGRIDPQKHFFAPIWYSTIGSCQPSHDVLSGSSLDVIVQCIAQFSHTAR